jgi:hypothetical protein
MLQLAAACSPAAQQDSPAVTQSQLHCLLSRGSCCRRDHVIGLGCIMLHHAVLHAAGLNLCALPCIAVAAAGFSAGAAGGTV